MKRKTKSIGLIIALLLSSTAVLSGCNLNPKIEVKEFTTEKEILKVGILSDSQLPEKESDDPAEKAYENNLRMSLKVLKDNDVDIIIFAGDIADIASDYTYQTYKKCYEDVFGEDMPIVQTIMGNHDYWFSSRHTPSSMRKLYEKNMNESPFSHYVVNGYHFIGLSPDCGDMTADYKKVQKWAKEQIEYAISQDPNKPIFVTTHNSPKDTVYGSDDWGDTSLNDIFKDYPQVVNFAGHAHYSLLDERAIWQGDYTAITTQSVSYTEMEGGKENGSIPPNSKVTPMGLIMTVSSENLSIKRINFATGLEEKENMRWNIKLPIKKDNFVYTNEIKKSNNVAPTMSNDTPEVVKINGVKHIKIKAGKDDDFVHSYKLEIENYKTLLYFSDFYNGIDNMSEYYYIPTDKMILGEYNIKIYAIDSYGLQSQNYQKITIKI